MNGSIRRISSARISGAFGASASGKPKRAKRAPPVSIRFNEEERHLLAERAGDQPVSSYIRHYVLNGEGRGRKKRGQTPVKDHRELARVLSALGRSELAGLFRDTLQAVEAGDLPLDEQTEYELRCACAEITAMRRDLVTALGLRNGATS